MITIDITDIKKLKITIPYNTGYFKKLTEMKNATWVMDGKYWDLPYSGYHLNELVLLFRRQNIRLTPRMRECLIKDVTSCLHPLQVELRTRRCRPQTIRMYMHHNRELLIHAVRFPEFITDNDIRSYLYDLANVKKESTSMLDLALNSFRFYYGRILKKRFIFEITQAKGNTKLPAVLSGEEVAKLVSLNLDIRYKAILMLTYSSGLRASEVVSLRPKDIDFQRKMIFVRGAKGRKSRYTICSSIALETLRIYYYATQPETWLFPGKRTDAHLSVQSATKIFTKAAAEAGITKKLNIRMLRHSFATHLLESGVDPPYVRHLLGHKKSKRTRIYPHINKRKLREIVNPLDTILKTGF
ncbi:MAG: hypothetical protein A2W19_13445 [Spirochaetes bacterium RBG_16_49_21]|nr:MAG: hypothetical protein A2W19_13445 [Spirochaetes bacterium RBG_16_49_21]